MPLPEFVGARIASAERTEARPVPYRADLVVELHGPKGPVGAVVVEIQMSRDGRKRQTWPLYVTSVHAELRCPTVLLVVAPDEGVAKWARRPIVLGHPGLRFEPVVIGPTQVPRIDSRKVAAADPELAVLSSMAHGDEAGGWLTVRAALHAALHVDEERSRYYTHFILAALSDAMRARLEEEMRLGEFGEPTDLEKRILARGAEKGRTEGRAESILVVLESRGLVVPVEARERILACTDEPTLLAWLSRAVVVEAVEALFVADS